MVCAAGRSCADWLPINGGTVEQIQPSEDCAVLLRTLLARIFGVAIVLNYPWERAQAQLYLSPQGADIAWWQCFVASLVDGFFLLLMFGIGWVVCGDRAWFLRPGVKGYFIMLLSGVIFSISVEWVTVYLAHRWSYSERMPLVPGLEIGLTPFGQMLVLPPVIFSFVRLWQKRKRPPTSVVQP